MAKRKGTFVEKICADGVCRRRLSDIINEDQANPAGARTVEFAEVNALPLTECQFAVTYRHGLRNADQRSLDMRGAVTLGVAVNRIVFRSHRLEAGQKIVF